MDEYFKIIKGQATSNNSLEMKEAFLVLRQMYLALLDAGFKEREAIRFTVELCKTNKV